MEWKILQNETQKLPADGNDYSVKATAKTCTSLNWFGILFCADSLHSPKSGYLFRLMDDGHTELLRFSNEPKNTTKLQTRTGEAPIDGHSYQLRIEKSGSVYRGYIRDVTDEKLTDSQDTGEEPWPVFEFPLKAARGRLAAVVGDTVLDNSEHKTKTGLQIESCDSTNTTGCAIKTYQNPILAGYADPDVLYYQGTYYLYATSSTLKTGYEAYASKDLVNWEYAGVVMGEAWGMGQCYWAPDIMERNGKFYILASVNEHLGIATSDSPLGPFVPEPNYLFDKSIDGHFLIDDDGSVYIYYVSWREEKTYALYGMKMENDCVTPILSTETLLIEAKEEWECQKAPVAEAPYIIKHKGKYYLTYSGSHYESKGYAVGYATSDQPLGPYKKYEANPILSYHYLVHGPGHHCIVTSPDGRDLFILYHTHHDTKEVQPRSLCIDRMRFASVSGKEDKLEVYGPTVTPQPYPLLRE